ncbi:MAG: hypothetical protein ACOC5L_00640 [Halobacteriota archaeon]
MPSGAIASAILLIAMAITASIVFNTLSSNYELLRKADIKKGEINYNQLHTFLSIDNVSYSSGTVIINATNDGSTVIQTKKIELLFDGGLYTDNITSTTVDGKEVNIWIPEETLTVEVNSSLNPSRIKLVADNGASGYWSV